ncbi:MULTISPECIES: PASTA domain-containing protein [unclassified Pseudoclavibacter]|uniref:PASTA domain-containing protein n=1 Tax=unclassified Pseudoclavibacter TaxID=2615177 RepID=UPI0011B0A4B7|nr:MULTISPECIES: PASTA domain-containing protein [unclassified Pseudoclavibacter]MBF4550377.1 PASTA domain-containing protein [Pseudoclavibacter sp. VKM Ac-2888]
MTAPETGGSKSPLKTALLLLCGVLLVALSGVLVFSVSDCTQPKPPPTSSEALPPTSAVATQVPVVVGLSVDEAAARLAEAGLAPIYISERDIDWDPEDRIVVTAWPQSGEITEDGTVALRVSAPVRSPQGSGSGSDAQALLERLWQVQDFADGFDRPHDGGAASWYVGEVSGSVSDGLQVELRADSGSVSDTDRRRLVAEIGTLVKGTYPDLEKVVLTTSDGVPVEWSAASGG